MRNYHPVMEITFNGTKLKNLGHINVLLGKNGVGKSELLRKLDSYLVSNPATNLSKYISPERGGELAYHASVESNIRSNENWSRNSRRKNRVGEFRNMSFAEYKNLEILVLRKREADPSAPKFDVTLGQINGLLDHVNITRGSKADPEFKRRASGEVQKPETMSSGESELISVAIEVLAFCHLADHSDNAAKCKYLLVDEPDVHLHPDLQVRLIKLIAEATRGKSITTIIATHSTPVLAALADESDRVAFMTPSQTELTFRSVSQQLNRIIPVFGAHPLTNIFNQAPILLVEGEDDELIWQKAVRSSEGALKLHPCSVDTVTQLNSHETESADVMRAVYDNARGYSLRDGDGKSEELEDIGCVTRMRLRCFSAENLMLSDDVIQYAGTTWEKLLIQLREFAKDKSAHPKQADLKTFLDSGAQRRTSDLKEIRLLLAGFLTNKPWEILVGQSIARLVKGYKSEGPDSLQAYLGEKVCRQLLGITK